MIEKETTYEITDSHLRELLAEATKNGIQLGKDIAGKNKKIPINSPAFNPQRLFQSGHFKSLRKAIWDLRDRHGLYSHGAYIPDRAVYFSEDANDLIRKLTLIAFNAKTNKDIPIDYRQDAVDFYDLLAEKWLEFADDHLPSYLVRCEDT